MGAMERLHPLAAAGYFAGVAAVAGFGADQRRLAQTGGRAYELLFWKKE